ncbi:Flp pilus assembly protein CpaB [Aureimonas endophytica]|uniref:Flp pilus assembly protein CpaB n=1 Tax=Aureimonas endophytica TaxID=2027858 RepID=A0A916ZRS6_9HYPH|nr:Flp pilus assembly protein CpaB [Aureimonas endophytica]GGE09614.1 Flp pilus assembly protein CpaB [Aureimonas endophytica]
MNASRLAVLGVALSSAVGAGVVALNLSAREPAEPIVITAPSEPTVKLAEVLVTTRDIPMGGAVEGGLGWQSWPEDALGPSLILRGNRPNAVEELGGTLARQSFVTGEPVREDKLVKSDRGFMSVVLPQGKRAIAVQIAAETAAGGFILPNDHVDMIMTRKRMKDGVPTGEVDTETVLSNIRVLAIDQAIDEKSGSRSVIGTTATLEVDPEQAEAVTAAQQMADRIVLTLRSLEDSVPGGKGYAAFLLAGEQRPSRVHVVRYGQTSDVTTRK